MALPQRKEEQNLRDQPLGDVREVDREVGGGIWSRLWIYIVIAAAIVCIIWIAWGFGGTGGWWWGNRTHPAVANLVTSGPAGTNPLPTGNGVAVLNAPNKQAFIGKPFNVQNVTVQNKINNNAMWVGGKNGPMLLILGQSASSGGNADISTGQAINVTGTVQKAPSAQQAKNQWQLSDDDVNQLEQQGAYIQATQVASPNS